MEQRQTGDASFPDTRWSLIQGARATDTIAEGALAEWCGDYLVPIRKYIQAKVRDAAEAEELTQEFFQKLLTQGAQRVLPEQLEGAFRAHLMRSIKNFLIDHWRKGARQKRGGDVVHVSADALGDVAMDDDAGRSFDQSWAMNLMQLALTRMNREMEEKGKGKYFAAMAPYLGGRAMPEEVRTEVCAAFGIKPEHLRVSLHRLRVRYRSAIESEIRETVASEEEYQAEKRYMLSLWS